MLTGFNILRGTHYCYGHLPVLLGQHAQINKLIQTSIYIVLKLYKYIYMLQIKYEITTI